jgi:hypothetical protein
MSYRRRVRITRSGGKRTVSVSRSASRKSSGAMAPGRGWFQWGWGNNGRRARVGGSRRWLFFPWEKAFWGRVR